MCHDISSENLLANFFASHELRKISISELKSIRKKIEETFDFRVHVDITYESLIIAQEKNPDVFLWNDDHVKRGPKATDNFFSDIDSKFNWNIPTNILPMYKKLVAGHQL